MSLKIRKAAVIGAGVMGSGIAAHLANVGIPTLLLDLVPQELTDEEARRGWTMDHPRVRNRLADQAKASLLHISPRPLYLPKKAELITPGNLEDHLSLLAEVDWIIEAVTEKMEIKQQLLEKVESVWRPGIVVSSNTSGLSINRMAEGRSLAFRQHFLGTHFFNPVRYMSLLEVIPCHETLPEIIQGMIHFGRQVLGKEVVRCKDTVNFIANRIGTYGMMVTLQEMMAHQLGIDEVDEITGPVMGRPKSASFRTLDLVGLDTFVHVANNVYANVTDPAEKEMFVVPDFIQEMFRRGWLGDKRKQGFYKKEKGNRWVLDYETLEYRPTRKASFPSLEAAKQQPRLQDRWHVLLSGEDRASRFAWNVTKRVLLYSAEKIPEIADDLFSIDEAMRGGYNWQMGPFATWDAIGLERAVARMRNEGSQIPAWVEEMLAEGRRSFYVKEKGVPAFYIGRGEYKKTEEDQKRIDLAALKEQGKTILANPGASLIDIGDDVACLEFHSPHQAIGPDIMNMIDRACDEVSHNWRALVIGNQGKNFCVGANLWTLLAAAQEGDWEEIDETVKQFQQACLRLKYLDKPVVAAPFAMTLGGGSEVCLPADRVQAAAESYIGLVETGVGLIPGGGGCKELLLRHIEAVQESKEVDLQPLVSKTFATIALARVSSSAEEARKLGFLRREDGITVNRAYLLHEAKRAALALAGEYFPSPRRQKIRVVGEAGYAVMRMEAYAMKHAGHLSDHDVKIADKLAFVLAGGRLPANTWVSEEYLLDLEREAFLSLCGEPKTQERMQYMLAKGKPLRN